MSNSLSGQKLGKYEIRDLLGVGGMGAVYRAYDQSLSREVAIKVVNLSAAGTEIQDRFIREAKTAANLEHSHIVRIYDYGLERDINFVVMQNLTGGSLLDRMKEAIEQGRPRASLLEVALLLEHLASALDYAHAQGVVHRDIKPANIMFNNQGQAFIVDFGIAKLLNATNFRVTGTGYAMGTASYMPPEQWANKDITAVTDQYALAVTTYQLIAGRLPFEADSAEQIMYMHFNEQPTPLHVVRPGVPHDVMLVIGRAMSKDPAARFPNCTQFAQAFASAVSAVQTDSTNYFTFKMAKSKTSGAPYTPTPPNRSPNMPPPTIPPNTPSRITIPLPQNPRNLLIGGIGALLIIAVLALLLIDTRGNESAETTVTAQNLTLIAAGLATESATTQTRVGLEVIASATLEPTSTATDIVPTETATLTATASSTTAPTATYTSSPTVTVSPPITNTPIETSTDIPDVTLDVRLAAIATRDSFLTATATLWTQTPTPTDTPTPDIPATIAAEITALYHEDLTATATLWTPTLTFTPTATSTATATATFTLSPTATHTATSTATLTPTTTHTLTSTPTINLTATVEALALTGVTRNADWRPVEAAFSGVTMVLVPAGCFDMGSTTNDDEEPVHEQCFDAPFWIDKTEVTQAQFRANNGEQIRRSHFNGDNRPVEQITWFEADAYCQQRGGRLPTEVEWEYAARGPESWVYPWGDAFVEGNTVSSSNSDRETATVSSRTAGASWVGAHDLSGNVWEWTSSLDTPYPYVVSDGREADPIVGADAQRILRGGSWDNSIDFLRAANRNSQNPFNSINNLGLRCARDYDARTQSERTPSDQVATQASTVIHTPTITRTPTAVQSSTPDPLDLARTPITRNADWTPVEREFDGVIMVLVPAGCFEMGENGLGGRQCLETPFWIDQDERIDNEWRSAQVGLIPDGIDWNTASSRCIDRGMRLPTEAEWEYAARGVANLTYPWGNDLGVGNSIYNTWSSSREQIGENGKSWVGAIHLSGSTWEWTSTVYSAYPYTSDAESRDSSGQRTIRGGSWYVTANSIKATFRQPNPPRNAYTSAFDGATDGIRYRCVKPVD